MSKVSELDLMELYNRIEKDVVDSSTILGTLIDNKIEYPTYKQLQEKNILIDNYSSAVKVYNDVCSISSKLAYLQYNLRAMRKILLDQGFIVSFTDKMKRSIDTLYSEIQVLKESSFELRNSYEALTRYYSSVQYILGSSRLGGYDF